MRRAAVLVVLGVVMGTLAVIAQPLPPYKDASLPIERRVADLLARMTLEEKVAQTLAVWQQKRGLVDAERRVRSGEGGADPAERHRPDHPASDGVERGGKRRGPARDGRSSSTRSSTGSSSTRGSRIPGDVPRRGAARPRGGERHELSRSRSASPARWDPGARRARVHAVAAREARARGAQQVLSPVLDLARDPRWGRTEETYGEDPQLVSEIGLAAIRGYQGPGPALTPGHVFATAKHFAAHGPNEGGINTAPTQVPERELREELLWPFERAIREGHVTSVMPSYNEIDGVPSTASQFLLQRVLRQEWGFQGFVVSDYNAIEQLADRHQVAGSMAEAAALAIAAGVDLELPDRKAYLTLVDEVKAGTSR